MTTTDLDLRDAYSVGATFRSAAATLRGLPTRVGSRVQLPAEGRLLATGDLHDNPIHYQRVIHAARLGAGPDRHVVLHELIHGDRLLNGMDFSYRMLARVAALVLDHPGQVHPVLANHELSQMTGVGVSKGAGNSVELFRDAMDYVFGDDAGEVNDALMDFIAAMPLAVCSGGPGEPGVLCAHSLPSAAAFAHFDPDVLDRTLTDADYARPDGSAYLMTWGRAYDDTVIDALAERWNVSLFCLGHQHVASGIEAMGQRVVILNSDHESGRVLPLDLAELPRAPETIMYAMPVSALPDGPDGG